MFSTTKILTAHRPYHAPELTTISATGAYSYTVPFWCDKVDIVLIGGGKGGDNGAFLNAGEGGLAGAAVAATIVRGVGIPWTTTAITGSVGVGGASDAGNGGNTTATATGMTTQTANGATGLKPTNDQVGESRANVVHNGQTYIGGGGGAGGNPGAPGGAPGGGGGGGNSALGNPPGGVGGAGRAFFYAYQN